jgi:hypothetical protein
MQFLNVPEYLNRRAAALGIDPTGLIKDQESMMAEQQQQQQIALANKLGPNVINQAGRLIQSGDIDPTQFATGASMQPQGG